MHKLACLGVRLIDSTKEGIMVTNGAESLLVSEVKEMKDQDLMFFYLKVYVHKQRVLAFEQREYGVLKYQGRLCVPRVDGLQERILEEAHCSIFHSSGFHKNIPQLEKSILVGRLKQGNC